MIFFFFNWFYISSISEESASKYCIQPHVYTHIYKLHTGYSHMSSVLGAAGESVESPDQLQVTVLRIQANLEKHSLPSLQTFFR